MTKNNETNIKIWEQREESEKNTHLSYHRVNKYCLNFIQEISK